MFTVGHVLLDPANVDFQIFEPVVVVMALFAALFLVNGLILVLLADRIHPEPAYPVGTRAPRAAAGILALVCALGLVLMVDTVRTMVDDAGTCYSAVGGGEGCAALAL